MLLSLNGWTNRISEIQLPEYGGASITKYTFIINGKKHDYFIDELAGAWAKARRDILNEGGVSEYRLDKVFEQYLYQASLGVYTYTVGGGNTIMGDFQVYNKSSNYIFNLGTDKRITGWDKLWGGVRDERKLMNAINYYLPIYLHQLIG